MMDMERLQQVITDSIGKFCAESLAAKVQEFETPKLRELRELTDVVSRECRERVEGLTKAKDTEITDKIDTAIREWDKKLEERRPRKSVHVINMPDRTVTAEGVHKLFPLVMAVLAADVPLALVGPAGSGKTTMVEQAAKALGLAFAAQSFSPFSTKGELLGMRDASAYHRSAFRDVFENGGVFCADEMDACAPGTATLLNSAIANRYCQFPDGFVRAHKDFRVVACMNTFGTGPTAQYVGRNRLDAATLDRFATLHVEYDSDLEYKAIGIDRTSERAIKLDDGGIPTTDQWVKIVQDVRNFVLANSMQHLISPRASIYGSRLIGAGVGRKHLWSMLLLKGLTGNERESVQRMM